METDADSPPRRGRPPKSSEDAQAARARILAAARPMFARGGFEGVSMRAVAAAAGCSAAALYTLFPHKRALLRQIAEDAFAELDAELARTAPDVAAPVERLRWLGRAFVAFWLARPDHFRALFLIEDRVAEPGEAYFADDSPALAALVGRFLTLARQAVAARRLTGDPREIVELMFCGLHGVAAGLIAMPEAGWKRPELMGGRMTDALLRGLG